MPNTLGTIDEILARWNAPPTRWEKERNTDGEEGEEYVDIEVPWYADRYPVMSCPCPPPLADRATEKDVRVRGQVEVEHVVDEPETTLRLYRKDG